MSDHFIVKLQLNAECTQENVKSIMCRGLSLGLQATDHCCDLKVIFDNDSWLVITIGTLGGYLGVLLSDHDYAWRRDFKHWETADNISACRLLLDLCDEFLIKSIAITSDIQVLDRPGEEKAITANLFFYGTPEDAEDDARDIVNQASFYDYMFVQDLASMKFAPEDTAIETIAYGLASNEGSSIYLVVEGFALLLKIKRDLVTLVPQQPLRIKSVEEKSGIDLAFYTTILLNLSVDFGIDEITTNF